MAEEIKRYISNCKTCKRNKQTFHTRVLMQLTSTSCKPFERVALDIVGPLPISEKGNKYLLTFQDDLTKFSGAIPIQNQEAKTIAKTLCENFITFYFSDLGTKIH